MQEASGEDIALGCEAMRLEVLARLRRSVESHTAWLAAVTAQEAAHEQLTLDEDTDEEY